MPAPGIKVDYLIPAVRDRIRHYADDQLAVMNSNELWEVYCRSFGIPNASELRDGLENILMAALLGQLDNYEKSKKKG
jgi:hypothetical protein